MYIYARSAFDSENSTVDSQSLKLADFMIEASNKQNYYITNYENYNNILRSMQKKNCSEKILIFSTFDFVFDLLVNKIHQPSNCNPIRNRNVFGEFYFNSHFSKEFSDQNLVSFFSFLLLFFSLFNFSKMTKIVYFSFNFYFFFDWFVHSNYIHLHSFTFIHWFAFNLLLNLAERKEN